jgi:hypothetical protein
VNIDCDRSADSILTMLNDANAQTLPSSCPTISGRAAPARATNRGLQLKISTGFVLRIRSSVV